LGTNLRSWRPFTLSAYICVHLWLVLFSLSSRAFAVSFSVLRVLCFSVVSFPDF
jgi:hypothetical protein